MLVCALVVAFTQIIIACIHNYRMIRVAEIKAEAEQKRRKK
jgi:hypothetical protein